MPSSNQTVSSLYGGPHGRIKARGASYGAVPGGLSYREGRSLHGSSPLPAGPALSASACMPSHDSAAGRRMPDVPRPVHAESRTMASVNGREGPFCCLACALAAGQQGVKSLKIGRIADYENQAALDPERAFLARSSDVNPCAPRAFHHRRFQARQRNCLRSLLPERAGVPVADLRRALHGDPRRRPGDARRTSLSASWSDACMCVTSHDETDRAGSLCAGSLRRGEHTGLGANP
jgi:hypothetical protein